MSTEKDKLEKTKINAQVKHVPKDAQVIMSILKDLGIHEYEPRVINQLLEFCYRYVTCILDDAKVFANHARKKTIDLDDVKLATEVVLDKAFTCPPPRHVISKLAEVRNSMPLPPIKPHCGLRLPPDRYCLSACNYKLRAANQAKKMTKSALDNRSTIKAQVKGGAGSSVKRQTVVTPKAQVVTIPKPVIKFTTTPKTVSVDGSKVMSGSSGAAGGGISDTVGEVKMEVDTDTNTVVGSITTVQSSNSSAGVKRERDEDEFEVVP
ncbi:TBP-associated factor 9 [Musca autumnalis]|uniref:TBP-associated factor 9 n=1 Tax=Musca autumnalis TaxID=221902 RepID=UPI003CF642DA